VGNIYSEHITYNTSIIIKNCKINYIGFKNCKFKKDIVISNCEMQLPTFIRNEFLKSFKILGCTVYQLALLQYNDFRGDIWFENYNQKKDGLRFHHCNFYNNIFFITCNFNIFEFSFCKVPNFTPFFSFNDCTFRANADFKGVIFSSPIDFSYCNFLKDLYFSSYAANTHFTILNGGIRFWETDVSGIVDLTGAKVNNYIKVFSFNYGAFKKRWSDIDQKYVACTNHGPGIPAIQYMYEDPKYSRLISDRDLDAYVKLYKNYKNLGWIKDAKDVLFRIKYINTRIETNKFVSFFNKIFYEFGVGYFLKWDYILRSIAIVWVFFSMLYFILKNKYFKIPPSEILLKKITRIKFQRKNILIKEYLIIFNRFIEYNIKQFIESVLLSMEIFFNIIKFNKKTYSDSITFRVLFIIESFISIILIASLVATFTNAGLI